MDSASLSKAGEVALSNPSFLVIGAGQRGHAYGRAVQASTPGVVGAIAELDPFKRSDFGRKYIWENREPKYGEAFIDWREFLKWETARRKGEHEASFQKGIGQEDYVPISGVFICTLDETHREIITALAPLNLHILCEKPLALSLSDCLAIQSSLSQYPARIVSIGHVLRYSPHNILLRKLVCDEEVIGEIISIEHTEPIGYWHFAHSYVRGNWRRATQDGTGSLLTKSCHDIDFLMWMLCSPSSLNGTVPHEPSSITSSGRLTTFRKARKPAAAANASNCLECPIEDSCVVSATKVYRDRFLRKEKETAWPLCIVVPEIEDIVRSDGWDAAETKLMSRLKENYDEHTPRNEVQRRGWYGRCVYESDNDVCDDQTVTITWDEEPSPDADPKRSLGYGRGPKTALFHMTYPTEAQCQRRGRIYGSLGEITYDSKKIEVFRFETSTKTTHVIPKQPPEVEKAHGGGDWGLAGKFVEAVIAVEGSKDTKGGMSVEEAQRRYVGCDLEEIVRSHAVVFAAEQARIEKRIVDWREWWAGQKQTFGLQ
jgi:predicted dehydrogenase